MRLIPILITLVMANFSYADSCKESYRNRGISLQKTDEALNCYQEDLKSLTNILDRANAYANLSYLEFFKAEMFLTEKLSALESSINYAQKGAELFGELFDVVSYRKLDDVSKIVLAKNLYNYGTSVARYVDIKGKWEAIKRMGDIKNSMNSILRIGQADIAYHGAHRTLAIFHMKVPAIAGGKKELSKKYFLIVMDKTSYRGDLSRYPVNNLMFAEYYYSEKMLPAACRQLALIKDLDESEVKQMANGLYYETLKDVEKAKKVFKDYQCDTVTYTL